jgi:hypothetical protein
MQPVVGFIVVLQNKNEAPGTTFLLRFPVHNIYAARGDQNLLAICRSFQNVVTREPDVGPCRKSLWPRVDECQ